MSVSVNHRLPSGPIVIPVGPAPPLVLNAMSVPVGVIRPIRSALVSANHRLPSGPAVMPLVSVAIAALNSVTVPSVVIFPILTAGLNGRKSNSVNHRLPSGPAVMLEGAPPVKG